MPEIKVDQGQICDNGLGFPKKLDGLEAELQRIYNRLNVVRGSFRYDRTLGSRIPMMQADAPSAERLALRYAQEALLPCPAVTVTAVEMDGDRVLVCVETPKGAGRVTVYLKEDGHDI